MVLHMAHCQEIMYGEACDSSGSVMRILRDTGCLIILLNLMLHVSQSGPRGQEGREESMEPLETFSPRKVQASEL